MRRSSPEMFYTGQELEADVFGTFKKSKEFLRAYREVASESGYVPYQKAAELVRNFGEQDPTNPDKEFANDLRLEIIDQLGIEPDQEDRLKFFSAVGTPLDHFHGVDAWLEYEDPNSNRRVTITMDVTQREDKVNEGHKADIIIPDVPSPEDDAYLSFVEKFGKEIASQMASLIERERATGSQGSWQQKPSSRRVAQ